MTLRRATPDDVAMIAAWHPMEPAGVLEWWSDDEVLAWVLDVDGTPTAYGELWLDPEEDEVELLPLRPWVEGAKFNTIAIEVDEITGRHFELTRPWLHMRPHEDD